MNCVNSRDYHRFSPFPHQSVLIIHMRDFEGVSQLVPSNQIFLRFLQLRQTGPHLWNHQPPFRFLAQLYRSDMSLSRPSSSVEKYCVSCERNGSLPTMFSILVLFPMVSQYLSASEATAKLSHSPTPQVPARGDGFPYFKTSYLISTLSFQLPLFVYSCILLRPNQNSLNP